MTIVLKRKIMNEMMTTYLPSVLLILITYATTFFKPYFFEAALTVNLTTMLVMTTIFMTVMQMLPSTAYVKMIDIFLIFGQLYPFAEVVLLTIMEYHREGDGSTGEKEPAIGSEETPSIGSEDKPAIGSDEKPIGSEEKPISSEEKPAIGSEETTIVTVEAGKSPENKLNWLKFTGETYKGSLPQ